MQWNRFFKALIVSALLTSFSRADCIKNQDHRSNKNSGVLVTDLIISGTHTLSSDELNRMRSKLIGDCFDDDSEQLREQVKALFQNRGYFGVSVKSLQIKPLDPLGVPKAIALQAEVDEGPLYRLAEIKFSENHAFNVAKLRTVFPLKKGDLFERDKIAGGLETLRDLYGKVGYLDLTFIPDTQNFSNATISLTITIVEGPQYRMGKLDILANKDVANKLRAEWQLPEGAVFDISYINKYLNQNRSLLPPEFTRDSVQIVRDCPSASAEVRLPLDVSELASHPLRQSVNCETSEDIPK